MVIFHSYVSLPEGNVGFIQFHSHHPQVITSFMGTNHPGSAPDRLRNESQWEPRQLVLASVGSHAWPVRCHELGLLVKSLDFLLISGADMQSLVRFSGRKKLVKTPTFIYKDCHKHLTTSCWSTSWLTVEQSNLIHSKPSRHWMKTRDSLKKNSQDRTDPSWFSLHNSENRHPSCGNTHHARVDLLFGCRVIYVQVSSNITKSTK